MFYKDQSYESILSEICTFLNVKLCIRNRTKASYYIIRVENQKSLLILLNYLTTFPLNTHKYLDFVDFKKAFKIVLNKEHFSDKGGRAVLQYKNKMNSKRTFFNLKHLCRFIP